uniref:Integrin alpha-1 n=1 Tax=Phallusia mammillata TaxID=59560 RepID=A0A6F9DEU6_9ASCI|nr:integrin alpha-1 [Phallusia mammillata]
MEGFETWILCLFLAINVHFIHCINIATAQGTMAFIQPTVLPTGLTPRVETNSSTGGSDTTQPSYFGYDFTIGANSITIGAPKTTSSSQTTGIISRTSSPEANEATGDILSCSSANLFETSTKTKCSSVVPPGAQPGDAFGQSVDTSPTGDINTCSPTKQQDCLTVVYNPGFCYKSSNGGQTWQADPKTNDIKCPPVSSDIMFVLDGSSSVGNVSFDKVKAWTATLTSYFDLTKTQVGVIQYSHYYQSRPPGPENQPFIKTEVGLGSCTNIQCFNKSVSNISLHGYTTYTSHALNKTVLDFKSSSRFSNNSYSKVLILLTDGRSSDPAELPQAAKYVRSLGITTFAVGVGSDIVQSELGIIATGDPASTERVYTVADFTDLESIVANLRKAILTVSLEGAVDNTYDYAYNEELGENGFSTHYGRSGRLVLGTVGAYDWSGTFTVYSSTTDQVPDIPDFDQVRSVLPLRPKESYLGYSVTTGYYDGAGVGEYIAGGAPRYLLEGAVVVYRPNTLDDNKNFTNSHTIRPQYNEQVKNKQLGSYFGGTILSADVNGDSKDDLLVGAPLYIGNNFDEGRVFVYVSQPSNSVARWASANYQPIELTGEQRAGGRFGTSIALAGDLNDDGYNDVIIGAPLTEGDRGAIFVYHGSSTGVDTVLKQVILASSLKTNNLQYFGQSLQGGVDLDGNNYPDVAVGAPKSDTVVIFRTRPVVKFTSSVTYSKTSIDILACFNTPNRQCVNITSCISYTGKSVEPNLEILYNTTIDSVLNRIEFRAASNATTGDSVHSGNVTLVKDIEQCWSRLIYVKQNIQDYTFPLAVNMTFDLTEAHKSLPLSSVRDPSIPNKASDQTEFSKKCGPDKVCSYDLQVAVGITLPSNIMLPGRSEDLSNNGNKLVVTRATSVTPIVVRVNLSNAGENAFDTQVQIDYTSALSWTVMENIESSNGYSPCVQEISDKTRKDSKVLRYVHNTTLGSIMQENDWCSFVIKFSTSSLKDRGNIGNVQISVEAKTASVNQTDVDTSNNLRSNNYDVVYTSAADLAKRLVPDEARFNFTTTNDTVVSVQEVGNGSADLTIQYEVQGLGYANIPVSTLSLDFPSKLNNITHLLYPFKVDCVPSSSTTKCACDQTLINPYQLSLDPRNENNTNGSNVTMYPNPVPFTQPINFDCSDSSTDKSHCESLVCNINNLGELDKITFTVKFRLWTKALNFENLNDTIFKSMITHDTSPSTFIVFPDGTKTSIIKKQVDFPVKKYYPPVPPEPPVDLLWVYIVAAIAGLLLLIIIIVVMWKTGFFKSKYADMKQEALEWNEAGDGANGAMDQSTEGMLES